MKVSAINYQTNPHSFKGEGSKNRLKNAAGAAAIAIAAAAPMAEADAQFYYVPVTPQYYSYVPTKTVTSVPNCFVVGDITKSDPDENDKSMRQVFDEIDENGNENGVISAKEVMRTERKNWNETQLYPYTDEQMSEDAAEFNALSKMYNEDGSDPNTMNYREFKNVMNTYMNNKNVDKFVDLMRVLTIPYYTLPTLPYYYYPRPHYHRPYGPPPPHHHRPAPPHNHKYNEYHRHW